jgi:LacI family transcriptional regulator
MVKIRDVALEAAVSSATVSRVLNGKPNVDFDLAVRVRAAAERLGYRPNGLARNLRRRATDLLALIISDVGNPFFTAVTRGVEDIARANGYSVLLCNADENPERESVYLAVAEREQVAGVILSPHHASTDIRRLRQASIPVVVVDRELDGAQTDSVIVQSRKGARSATDHLIDAGWLRPGCITGPKDASTAQARLQGYLDAVEAQGGAPIFRHAPYRQQGGRAAAAELLELREPPDSLFVANSEMALGALDEIKRRGLALGNDLGFIMFDDTSWAPLLSPAISVVAQPAYDVGAMAADLLMQHLKGVASATPRQVLLSTLTIARDSSQRGKLVGVARY